MTIHTYKFSYEIPPNDSYKIQYRDDRNYKGADYIQKTINHIREFGGLPDFILPPFYRITATIEPKNLNVEVGWDLQIKILKKNLDDTYNILVDTYANTVYGNSYQLFTYNKEILPSPKSSELLFYDDWFSQFGHFYPDDLTEDGNIEDFEANLEYWSDGFMIEGGGYIDPSMIVNVVFTYSDDDPSAGDEYVEPIEPPKRNKIYLVNLDFGYRRSRGKNKNRRKYRNRY